MSADEKDPTQARYLAEGICPRCRCPLIRTSVYVAVCPKDHCPVAWRSKRVAVVFPKGELPDLYS